MHKTFFTRALAIASLAMVLVGSVAVSERSAAAARVSFAARSAADVSFAARSAATRRPEVGPPSRVLATPPARIRRAQAASQAARRGAGVKRRARRTRPFIWPARGRVTSGFGRRFSPVTGLHEHHGAIDIACRYGRPIRAARGGKVLFGGWMPVFGRAVAIRHPGGMVTFYSHMRSLAVYGGRTVEQGQTIGRCGQSGWATGPHLHFELRRPSGRAIDPKKYLPSPAPARVRAQRATHERAEKARAAKHRGAQKRAGRRAR